jgi:hypothetical protein
VPAFVQNGKRLLEASQKMEIVPLVRLRYLSELTETVKRYNRKEEEQSEITSQSSTFCGFDCDQQVRQAKCSGCFAQCEKAMPAK